ncbi:ras guanine nucleotide exchange factor domain-containing protein [Mycena leptocephala]|nr:ras guanine nucleotide exchange factor domain-containing protein [Mycena leptocephala]
MSPDLALAVLSLTNEVAAIICNGPKGHVSITFTSTIRKPAHSRQKELEDLNNRCIARLSSLQDLEASSMPLDDRTITRFLDETEMVLQGIITKLKSRRKWNFVFAFIKQDELQGWALEQNRKVDEQFRTMMMQILVTIGRQVMEMKARQENDQDEILNEIRSQFGKISSRFQGEPSLDARLVDEALDLVTKQPVPHTPTLTPSPQSPRIRREPPSLPHLSPLNSLSFDGLLPSPREPTIAEQSPSRTVLSQPPHTPTGQSAPCIVPPQPLDTRSIFSNDNGKIYGNSLGLINHWLVTEDEHFKQVMLKTYLDHATSETMLDIIERKFKEARPETLRFVAQRAKLIEVLVNWLNTLPSEELVHRLRVFASGDVCALIPDHTTMILDAIKNRPRPPILPARRGPTTEPQHPEELALALTHMEHDFHKTLRSIDYLCYARGSPSRVDTWLSNYGKMICWVKYVVLRQDEIRDRAESMKRFIKAGQVRNLLRFRFATDISAGVSPTTKLQFLAAIARALDPTVNPMHDLVRTLEQLSRDKRAMLEDLTRIIDPDQNYKAYHKRIKKLRAANYIPCCRTRCCQFPPVEISVNRQ